MLMSGAALGVLTFATAAGAADAATDDIARATAPSEVTGVVVTATKRSERLQDVPLSVTAITAKSIDEQGISSLGDYVTRSPGLHLSEDGTQSTFTVRGISSSTSADTTSSTAGIYVDDYPLYDTWFRFASPDLRIFDVDRIEVLRGPQGTLYGATSLSGSVRIITAKPNLNGFGAKVEATGATTDGGEASYALNAMVNIPIIADKLGLRAVAYSREDGGYIDNPVRGRKNVNSQSVYGGRLYVSARPSETLGILASVTYQHDLHDDNGGSYYFPPAGRSVTDFNSVLPTRVKSELLIGSLVIDQQLGAGDLNISATLAYDQSDNIGDGTPISTAFGLPIPTPFTQPSRSRSKIVEARYTSDPSQPFRYVAGVYFNTRYRTLLQNADQAALAPFFGTGKIYDVYADQRATEAAIYGEATWAFTPEWEATVGLRVFKNRYKFNSYVSGLLNSFVTPLTPSITHLASSDTSGTPRVSLSYKPTRDINVYATVSEGFRFGLTNYNSGANAGVPLIYKSDALWNYELGAKLTFMDGRASLNSSIYYMDWRDIQLSFRNANGQVYITNAGNARSYGLESELLLRPDARWEINAALSLGKAELTTDNPGVLRRAGSIRGPAIYGVKSGDDLPGSQRVSFSGGVQYNIEDFAGGRVYLRVDEIYVGPSYVDFLKTGSLKIGDYNLVNLRASYSRANYEVAVFANNVFNNHGVVNAVPDGDITGLTDWAYRVRPRTVGVTLRAHF
jgi:outer membrane receptor protein involved in Fe transport